MTGLLSFLVTPPLPMSSNWTFWARRDALRTAEMATCFSRAYDMLGREEVDRERERRERRWRNVEGDVLKEGGWELMEKSAGAEERRDGAATSEFAFRLRGSSSFLARLLESLAVKTRHRPSSSCALRKKKV